MGPARFRSIYGVEPRFNLETDGLFWQERVMVDPETLRRLAERYPLGIATGRPRAEAWLALELMGVKDLFQCVVTDDDIREEEEARRKRTGTRPNLRKPDAYSVLAALDGLDDGMLPGAYVGDMPDDIRAARAANRQRPVLSIGCCAAAKDPVAQRKAFTESLAGLIVDDVEELAKWLLA